MATIEAGQGQKRFGHDDAVREALARWGEDATLEVRPGPHALYRVGEEGEGGPTWWGEGRSWEEAFAHATRTAVVALRALAA